MSKSLPILLILFSSLTLFTLALNPVSQGNYFFVPADNHLSYELYQTRSGIIAHSIEPFDENDYISRYTLINLATKDAFPILSDLVSSCDNLNPTFQSLHYHNQTDSLIYYCTKNTSLLILNQQDYTVQTTISLNLSTSLPIARLSSDGMNVVVLLMDTLFTQYPQNSVLFKVDVQTKTISNQVPFNEAVVAYAAGKKNNYIATNLVQGNILTTTVYSIIVIGNTYQLNKVASFPFSIMPFQIITKLFSLEDYIVVSNGVYLNFVNQQGTVVKSTQVKIKPINGQNSELFQPTVTAQNGGTSLYALSVIFRLDIYSIANNAIQTNELPNTFGDFQIAFGDAATPGGDLLFALDYLKSFFSIFDTKDFQPVYQAVSGYADIILTNSTYAVVQGYDPAHYRLYIFDLKTDALLMKTPLGANYYYNKEQHIITLLNPLIPSGCVICHIDIVSGKDWTAGIFSQEDPICSSYVASARLTDKGKPEIVFPFADRYVIISATYGKVTFPITSDIDSVNVNFNDLSLYYLSANQTTNQVTASLYSYNPLTRSFVRINTIVIDKRPVENQGFFTLSQSTTVALSNMSFAIIDKLNSVWSLDVFPNNYNLVTTFIDDSQTQLIFFGYNNSKLINGGAPVLLSSTFIDIPGKRTNTVNGRATGSFSFCLHDDLYSTIGLVRLYSSDSNQKIISM